MKFKVGDRICFERNEEECVEGTVLTTWETSKSAPVTFCRTTLDDGGTLTFSSRTDKVTLAPLQSATLRALHLWQEKQWLEEFEARMKKDKHAF